MRYDVAIIGTGPAGVSAALTLKIHRKNVLWLGSKTLSDKISKAERISNYPGLPDISGADMNRAFLAQVEAMGIEITEAMVTSVYPMGDYYALAAGTEVYEATTVLLTTGVAGARTLPGEEKLLGRGVSYCATCDGMLYRGKKIAVLCGSRRFEHEAEFLASLAAEVAFFPLYAAPGALPENVRIMESRPVAVLGEKKVEGLRLADGTELAVDGLFCLRDAIALNTLLPGLAVEGGHIVVDRHMATSLPGCFAAGDCTGRPYQYTKAVGEGNVAAHAIVEYLAEKEKKQ